MAPQPLLMTIKPKTVHLAGATGHLAPPLDAREFAGELARLRLAANGPESEEQWADYLAALKEVDEGFLVAFGLRLFNRVFVGTVQERYRKTAGPLALALEETREEASLHLSALPWELLHDGAGWVARDRGILRLAQVEVPAGSAEAPPGDRLRVLVAMASPLLNEALRPDDPRQPFMVDLEREAEVFRTLHGQAFPADLTLRLHATREDLSWELGGRYHVFHFLGHGNIGVLALEDRHGVMDPVNTAWLRERVLRTGLGLAVLQSCLTAADAPRVPGVARTLLEAGLPRVLAMQHTISIAGARHFFARLYAELARGVGLLEALRCARHALADAANRREADLWEWATPVLWVGHEALAADTWPALAAPTVAPARVEERPPRPRLDPMMQRERRFVGRRAELVAVARGLDPQAEGGSRVVLLHGEGGMGKTAIAVEAVHRWAGWFEEVVYASGRGRRAPEEVELHLAAYARERLASEEGAFLADLAEGLGLARGVALRRILEALGDGRRRLLMLDNLDPFVRSAAVLDLLSRLPPRCRALVTSREEPNVDAQKVPVERLPSSDAARLVGAYAGERGLPLDAKQWVQLYTITGGHPMTLRLVVAQVASRAKTWERALADLRRAEGPVFDYIFADSLALAGEAGPRLFRLLAAFAPWAGREALRATGLYDETALGEALARLVGLALVEAYPGYRYGLQEQALAKAGRLLHEAFLEDREGLLRAVEWAHRAKDWPLVVRMAGNLAPFYSIRALWPDWQRTHELALEAACKAGDRHGEGQTLGNLGSVYADQGRWAEAIRMYEESRRIMRELGDRHGQGLTLNNLGIVYAQQGRWAEAIEMYEESRRIMRELGDRHGQGLTLNNLGIVYAQQGRWAEASQCYGQDLAICRELGDRHGEGKTLNNLGTVYAEQGRWAEAIQCYDESLGILRELGDRHGESQTLGNLGSVYLQQGRWAEAIQMYEQSRHIFRELGDRHGQGLTLGNLGNVYFQQGRWAEAIRMYEESLPILRELGDRQGERQTLLNLGAAYFEMGQLAKAAECYRQSLTLGEELGDRRGIATALHQLGILSQRLDDLAEARHLYEESLRAKHELGDRLGIANTLAQLASLHRALGEHEQAIGKYEEALRFFKDVGDGTGAAEACYRLGLLVERTGDITRAEEYFQQARAYREALGNERLAEIDYGLGRIWVKQGRWYDALEVLKEALVIRRQGEDLGAQADVIREIGFVHHLLGDYDLARTRYHDALRLYEHIKDKRGIAVTITRLGRLEIQLERISSAVQHLTRARQLLLDLSDDEEVAAVTQMLQIAQRVAEGDKHWR